MSVQVLPWRKPGLYEKSAQAIEQALAIIGEKPEHAGGQTDAGDEAY